MKPIMFTLGRGWGGSDVTLYAGEDYSAALSTAEAAGKTGDFGTIDIFRAPTPVRTFKFTNKAAQASEQAGAV